MPQLNQAGDSGALDHVDISQAQFRTQIATLVDMLRQLGGDANVVAGSGAAMDPLSAPFTLYVNPYTGSDKFVGGPYNSYELASGTDEEKIAQKLKRLEKQRMTCGYTPYRPFRSINRAVIEAAIITSKEWYTYTDPKAHVDCVSIVLSTGVHILYNDPGSASSSLTSWGASKDPTAADLIAFNPPTTGGVLLPRGCSLCGPDLRKTTIRPNWVPSPADEAADYSNRRGMLKITGTGYFFGFTFMDKVGETTSHHLLDAFQFASKSELDLFYLKCTSTVGTGADLSATLTATRGTEYQIVGPIDISQTPTSAWDTTASASPYIFNCSVRSDYGMGGAFMDGSKVQGLKSMVCANFTGVSLQKDMSSWQRYDNGWTSTTYTQYINADPDNVRMNPARISRHISAINDAFIQEVSVFAIGHGIHHFTDKGGEITITNSNSSFGGCAALSQGYKPKAFLSDQNWVVANIKVPLDIGEKTGNVRNIYLGTISTFSSSTITLINELAATQDSATIPEVLFNDGYSLRGATKIWVENPQGDPWSATLSASAWSSSNAAVINISTELNSENTADASPEGKRVYIRRLVDTRTPNERRTSLILSNTGSARLPQRNYVLQTDPNRANGAVTSLFDASTAVFPVTSAGSEAITGGATVSSEITIRRGGANRSYANNTFYTAGTVVKYNGKHYQVTRDLTTSTATPDSNWSETFVHMPSDYNAEDPIGQEGKIITIDTDTDTDPFSETLGIDFSTAYTTSGSVRDQYRASTDYLGVHAFLVAIGYSEATAHSYLVPKTESARRLNPASATNFPTAPSGGAASDRGNWAVELRRPSVLRLFGHAWEWAGFLNYTKAIPAAQKDLGAQNKFTYYFTNSLGGRVVPQGSNEDGFNITPRGLEDIETGTTLSVESLGTSSVDEQIQTSFDNLSVTELTVTNLNVTGNISGLPEVGNAKIDSVGPVYLASLSRLESLNAAASDAQINANPYAVTVDGLNYWRTRNNFLAAPVGTQVIYVDPSAPIDRSLTQMLSAPPTTTSNRAKNFGRAVGYANVAYSPSVTVEFRLGPGIYIESGDVTFLTNAVIRAWDYTTNSYLNDAGSGGTQPFLGGSSETFANYLDPTKQPIFLTRPIAQYDDSSTRLFGISFSDALTLVFKQRGEVTGVAWWGITETITGGYSSNITNARNRVPDSFLSTTKVTADHYRADAVNDPDNAVNYFVRAVAIRVASADSNGFYRYYGHRADACVIFEQAGRLTNIAFGANTPAASEILGDQTIIYSAVQIRSSEVEINGVRFIGNLKISSELNTNTTVLVSGDPVARNYSNIRYRGDGSYTTSNYLRTGHHISFIGPDKNGDVSAPMAVGFGTNRGPITDGLSNNNVPWINFSLVAANYSGGNVSFSIANSTDPPTNTSWKTNGPSFYGFINGFQGLRPGGTFRNWNQFLLQNAATSSPGFNGLFGNYANSDASSTTSPTHYTIGSLFYLSSTAINIDRINTQPAETPFTYFSDAGAARTAGVGVPDVASYTSGLSAGEIGQNLTRTSSTGLFTPLNIKLRGFKLGINTTTANIIKLDMVL